jgi:hypothetical protein
MDPVLLPQFYCFGGADIRLVTDDFQVGMFAEHFKTGLQIRAVSTCQFKVEDDTPCIFRTSFPRPGRQAARLYPQGRWGKTAPPVPGPLSRSTL